METRDIGYIYSRVVYLISVVYKVRRQKEARMMDDQDEYGEEY